MVISVEVVPKMVIFRLGRSENGNFPSRLFRKLECSVDVVLKMVISRRGDAENCHLSRFKIPIRICSIRFKDSEIWGKIQDQDLSLNLKN